MPAAIGDRTQRVQVPWHAARSACWVQPVAEDGRPCAADPTTTRPATCTRRDRVSHTTITPAVPSSRTAVDRPGRQKLLESVAGSARRDADRRTQTRRAQAKQRADYTPPCPNSASNSRTPTASAPKPKTRKARPPRAAKGPRHAQATTRRSEEDREAVDMDITRSSRPSGAPDVARSDATTRFLTIVHPMRPRAIVACIRTCVAVAGPRSAWRCQGCVALDRLENRRRRLLHAGERLRQRRTVSTVQMQVVAGCIGNIKTDGVAHDEGHRFGFQLSRDARGRSSP